ncbi:hypothetical protein HYALB_00004444 [Hymenoscyphus albidus]|uniref:C2H2-type domain-containing protein n=1 Tax=Hymenoscyphus albidus TaxID=595503 RepID=A0A9N9LL82_9HELO|nr:hypothetical protein HYALB_00004444 [Hymenoscyphus albidus]
MGKRSRSSSELSESETSNTAQAVPHFTSSLPSSSKKLSKLDPELSESDGEKPEGHKITMRCSLPPHRETLSFPDLDSFEVHYKKTHSNRCLECRRNFPTEHFLSLHIQENHDAITAVLRERGEKTYACFVEDCDRVCSTPEKRRLHLIDKHAYPKDYDFVVVDTGVDMRSSMLISGRHRRRSPATHKKEMEDRAKRRNSALKTFTTTEKEQTESKRAAATEKSSTQKDLDMNGLTNAMSSLKFIPTSVKFGRGRGRGGFSRT